jgi:hypothetical protein
MTSNRNAGATRFACMAALATMHVASLLPDCNMCFDNCEALYLASFQSFCDAGGHACEGRALQPPQHQRRAAKIHLYLGRRLQPRLAVHLQRRPQKRVETSAIGLPGCLHKVTKGILSIPRFPTDTAHEVG